MKEWILITGASSGIGRAIAVELSREYNLVLGGRDAERLAETAAACEGACETKFWQCDLASEGSVGKALEDFLSTAGITITRFVHAAGVSRIMPIGVTRPEDVESVFRVNALAPFELVQALVSRRVNSAALRSVVFVSSVIAERAAKGHVVYGASKAALDGLMRGLAVELAPKVRVNSVLPGFVRTAMTEAVLTDPAVADRLAAQYPLGLGAPRSVADAVAFLLSERASWVTGHQLVVDGGRSVDISA